MRSLLCVWRYRNRRTDVTDVSRTMHIKRRKKAGGESEPAKWKGDFSIAGDPKENLNEFLTKPKGKPTKSHLGESLTLQTLKGF